MSFTHSFFARKLTISDDPKFLDLTFGSLSVSLTLPMLIIESYSPTHTTHIFREKFITTS